MRYADLYTKVILTIIAVLLVWNTLDLPRVPAVHAQSPSSRYAAERLIWPGSPSNGDWDQQALETAINNAAKGRELVTVVVPPGQGRILAGVRACLRCTLRDPGRFVFTRRVGGHLRVPHFQHKNTKAVMTEPDNPSRPPGPPQIAYGAAGPARS